MMLRLTETRGSLDAGSDLDPARLCADSGQQRKRGSELAREMVDTEIGSIRP